MFPGGKSQQSATPDIKIGTTFQMSSRTPVPQNLTRRPHHPVTPSTTTITHSLNHLRRSSYVHSIANFTLYSIATMNADNILNIAATENHWSITDFTVSLYTSPNDTKPTPVNLVDWIKVPDTTSNGNKKYTNYSKAQSVSTPLV